MITCDFGSRRVAVTKKEIQRGQVERRKFHNTQSDGNALRPDFNDLSCPGQNETANKEGNGYDGGNDEYSHILVCYVSGFGGRRSVIRVAL